jgi:hypothetical protein
MFRWIGVSTGTTRVFGPAGCLPSGYVNDQEYCCAVTPICIAPLGTSSTFGSL